MKNFKVYINNYLNSLQKTSSKESTITYYKYDLFSWLDFVKDSKRIDALSLECHYQYLNFLENKKLKINTKRRKLQALRLFFDYLQREEIIIENTLPLVGGVDKVEDLPICIEFKDILKIFELQEDALSLRGDLNRILSLRNIILTRLIFLYGLSVNKLSKIKRKDLIFNKYNNDNKQKIITLNSTYQISLSKNDSDLIDQYLELLSKNIENFENKVEFLFVSANKHKIIRYSITDRSIELIFKKLSQDLEINVAPKNLRNSCISFWIQKKVPLTKIKERMGVSRNYDISRYQKIAFKHIYSDDFLL